MRPPPMICEPVPNAPAAVPPAPNGGAPFWLDLERGRRQQQNIDWMNPRLAGFRLSTSSVGYSGMSSLIIVMQLGPGNDVATVI